MISRSIINIKGYNLYRADHPNNVERSGLCAYIRESVAVTSYVGTYW